MKNHVEKNGLKVDEVLLNFIEKEALPGTGIDSHKFWKGFSELVKNLGPKNNEKSNEVRVANIALVDKNSTTLNGPKNSLRYSNTGNNIT